MYNEVKETENAGCCKMSETNKTADDVSLLPFQGRTVKASDITGNQMNGQLKAINKDHLTLYDDVSGWTFLPRHQLKNMTVSITDEANSLSLEDLQDKTLPEMLMLLKYRPVQIWQNDANILQGLLTEVGDHHLVLTRQDEVVYVSIEHILSIRYVTNDNEVSYQPIALQSGAFDPLITQSVSQDEPVQGLDAGTIETMTASAEGEADDGSSNNNQEIDGSSNYVPNYSPSYQATSVSLVSDSQSYQNVYSPITNSNNEDINNCETPINPPPLKTVYKGALSPSSNRKKMKKRRPLLRVIAAVHPEEDNRSPRSPRKETSSATEAIRCLSNSGGLNAAPSIISKPDLRKA
jgi:hypothetical protein